MVRTTVGYCGGTTAAPTYRAIGDHCEALEVVYRPEVVSYAQLLRFFFQEHRPVRPAYKRQYASAVFCENADEAAQAQSAAEDAARAYGAAVLTEVACGMPFTPAEDYHQKYRLQRLGEVTTHLIARYGGFWPFCAAPTSMRLNAYLGGGRPRAAFADEAPAFDLNPTLLRILDKHLR